jgi:putative redox protein
MEMQITLGERQKVNISYKGFDITTDQPEKSGGENSAPAPFDLFMISIGACAGWYVKSFCQQRGLDESNIRLVQKTSYNREKKLIDKVEIEIHLPDDFPDKYRDAVVKAAESCSVKKHIYDAPDFSIVTIK